MIILDTNVISELIRPRPAASVLGWLDSITGETVATTAITSAELYGGIELLPEGRRRRDLAITVERILNRDLDTKILPFDHAASQRYAPILASRHSAGKPIIRADAQIASICAKHGATLATRNVKDFTDTGIDLINPWES